ncbi:CsiV family protein [Thalassotalea profundi]|uniref:Uncharacterized protein n=1 Tax=Thalassotalea profundi TaxID=2036687 RepID=A0ABQ3IEV4_9GAMM|nr:CsiV family protein [Thalassotalea profundi]GHE77204.1 hypothetical protein GCM10011501_00830 [Thalassotalea profundi]
MKTKQAVTLLSSLLVSSAVLAASPDRGRWFDIEVILISQLGDKAKLNEIFADNVKLPSFNNPLDLLTPYLNPDIHALKQQLPFCNSKNQLFTYHEKVQEPSIVTLKPLAVIEEETNQAITTTQALPESDSTPNNTDTITHDSSYQNDDFFDRVTTEKEKVDEEQLTQISLVNDTSPTLDSELSQTITPEQIAWVNEAEQFFSPIQLTYSQTLLAPNDENLLCQITKAEFDKLSPDNNIYSYLGFAVKEVPSKISAIEDLFNPKPYLLNNDSLALNNIVTQLKRSRDFRPILHLAWRQPVHSRRNAIPIKLFAGDNLQQNYIEQLKLYQQQQSQVIAQEQSFNTILSNNDSTEMVLTEQEQLVKNKEQKLKNIIEQLSLITNDTTHLIDEIEQAPTSINMEGVANNNLMLSPPTEPLQPWYVQGFMQIYINNNNRLNIIADFNMLNLTLAEQETIKLIPDAELALQTISFKQHRQVISTETHYFDHPYLGMIVQIRRHTRPEPPIESEIEGIQ